MRNANEVLSRSCKKIVRNAQKILMDENIFIEKKY